MKTSKVTRWMIAAAALAAAAGSAAAQTFTAEIPMSFRVGNKMMLPGSYQVRQVKVNSTEIVYLSNLGTHDRAVTLPGGQGDPSKAWAKNGNPMLGFQCVGGSCALTRLWDGRGQFAYHFGARKLPFGGESMTSIMLEPVKAD